MDEEEIEAEIEEVVEVETEEAVETEIEEVVEMEIEAADVRRINQNIVPLRSFSKKA